MNGLHCEVEFEALQALHHQYEIQDVSAYCVFWVNEVEVVLSDGLYLWQLLLLLFLGNLIENRLPFYLQKKCRITVMTSPITDRPKRSVLVVQRAPSMPMKVQNQVLLELSIKKLPTILPKGCIPACRQPARTGSSNSTTAAASIPTSPILMKTNITNSSPIVSLYSYWLSAMKARGYVRIDVTSRLSKIQNLRLPQRRTVNFYTIGAKIGRKLPVRNLKLKGRAARLKELSTSGLGNTGKRQTMSPKRAPYTPWMKYMYPTKALMNKLGFYAIYDICVAKYQLMSKTLKDIWAELAVFIIHKNSLDIGALNRIFLQASQTYQEQSAFITQIDAFLQAISSQSKSKSQLHAQALALMGVQALLYNMYNMVRGNQGFKPASSSFYGFMSMSHLSADYSETSHLNDAEAKRIISLIEHLANSDPFFRRVKIILDRNTNKERNHRYGENLIETINHILTKEKCNRQNFNKLRSKYTIFTAPSKNKVVVDFRKVNEIIFSNQLNKIGRLLTQGSDEVHLSLMRIYFGEKEGKERKQFQGSGYSGEDMVYNLHHYYIESFQDENDLFQESKHPLFRLIRNQLLLFFTPFLHQFHSIISRLAVKGDVENAWTFYKTSESSLREDLLAFVASIPFDLVKLLHSLYRMVQQIYRMPKDGAVNIVKKLLFYSFLCSQTVIEDLLPQIDPAKYTHIYNHTINLFFQTSLRKFHDLPPQKLTLLTALIHQISSALDSKIGNGPNHLLQEDANELNELSFSIKDPILNYDYEIVHQAQERIEFTPKDSKKFTMLKEGEKAIESPIYKHFRKETSINLQSDHGEGDLATWMSVGGSHDWGVKGKQSKRQKLSVKQSLKGLSTLRGEKVKELDRLRSEFQYYL